MTVLTSKREMTAALRQAPSDWQFRHWFETEAERVKANEEYAVYRLKRLRTKVESLDKSLAAWKARFEKDPVDALNWSTAAFEDAATRQVILTVLGAAERIDETTPGLTRAQLVDRLLEYSRDSMMSYIPSSVSASSSPTANILTTAMLAAWRNGVDRSYWF